MHRFTRPILAAAMFVALAPAAMAQSDAADAYAQAKTALEAGQFAAARDLAQKAAETDVDNPEVFLLLGKTHYQLGDVDEAIAAWKKTLKLAPQQPYAKQMLATLQGQAAKVDVRIRLIEVLIQERLYFSAGAECDALLRDKRPSDAQRAKLMTLLAESTVRSGKGADARKVLHELLTLYPSQADPAQTTLLIAEAKLQGDGASVAEALATLKKLVAEHPDTPAAARAQYDLITHDPQFAPHAARADAMAKWLADNADHELADEARRGLVGTYLALTVQGVPPTAESDLSPADLKALAVVAEIFAQPLPAAEADALAKQILDHLRANYVDRGAHAAAIGAIETLLAAPAPPSGRLSMLKSLASFKYLLGTRWLEETARAGKLPVGVARGQLPEKLADVVATFQRIRKQFPAELMWIDHANLAKRVRASSSRVLPTAEFNGLAAPDAWALDVAMPAIAADADPAAVKSALETINGIIQERANDARPGSQELAVAIGTELAGTVIPTHSAFSQVISAHADLLGTYAAGQFQENIADGNAGQNAALSDAQKQLLATLAQQVAHDAAGAGAILDRLALHLEPWITHGHWGVAEEAFTTLAATLPETQRRRAELAVVNLWVQQVTREHARLSAAGLTVPKGLDPTLAKALARCRELQVGLADAPAELAKVRAVWDVVINHYLALQYYDVAEAATRVKPEQAIAEADEYAEFRLAALEESAAVRALNKQLARYGAKEKIGLSPEFRTAIDGWKKFIADRPDSDMVPRAAERISNIAGLFQRYGAFDVAARIYLDLAQFAGTINVLAQAAPGASSVAQRASFAHATALDALAQKALDEATAERQKGDAPPTKLSREFAVAIAAYQAFVANHPKSPLVADATSRIMTVATRYAAIDAWDVADAVFADLLDSKLEIRRPERLQFARGLCQLGRAMPDHARQILTTLTSAGLRGPGIATDPAMLASVGHRSSGPQPGTPGGAGRGGQGGGQAMPANQPEASTPAPNVPPGATFQAQMPVPPIDPTGAVEQTDEATRDTQLLAMIQQRESQAATQVAGLRDQIVQFDADVNVQAWANEGTMQNWARIIDSGNGSGVNGILVARNNNDDIQFEFTDGQAVAIALLSKAELARQEKAIAAAYEIFQNLRKDHPDTPTAVQARGEILVMVGHWRGLTQWQRAADLAGRFLTDNPTDAERPKLSLEVARDSLSWAAKPILDKMTRQEMLQAVSERFDTAREKLAAVVADFPKEKSFQQQAQWDVARSFLTQARVIGVFSPTLARGQYVRTARELRRVAKEHPDHPQIGTIPQMLWDVSAELENRAFNDEAILVLNELSIHDPMHQLSQQAALKIAQTYHQKLKRPLKAAQAYQELNFARGGADTSLQDAIFQIGSELKTQKRYVEALHVLETFVDSFPRHVQAGQALTMAGQIHQTNEAWEDAIAAYRRVIDEFEDGQFVQESKWAIAECTINLSQWREAMDAYRDYVKAYAEDAKVAEANRRIEVLKDLARYQGLVDEDGQRKAFDAQFQIAAIVAGQLSNPVKAIIEYRKVASNWPQCHLADDALYAIGTTYASLGETEKARTALLRVATEYPASPVADDALYTVGKSFEDEAVELATVTRETTIARNKEVAQRRAYQLAQDNRYRQQEVKSKRIAGLKQAGKGASAELEEASSAYNYSNFNDANVLLFAQKAEQEVESQTAAQLADRQDKINAALRKAVEAYTSSSKVAGADKADEALLQMATIYDQQLKDPKAAMATWLEIVRQFNGTDVAEDASWRIAQAYERQGDYTKAVEAYKNFLRSYRGGAKAPAAQFAIAENYEHLGEWINAMDAYTNYVNNYPEGPLVTKAKEQITWIKTYRL